MHSVIQWGHDEVLWTTRGAPKPCALSWASLKPQTPRTMSPSTATRERREFASEIKFLISPELADQVRRWARNALSPDPHAGGQAGDVYRITSLYFDTKSFDVFHHNSSFGRSKYRIRRYGNGEIAFLERKLKTKG